MAKAEVTDQIQYDELQKLYEKAKTFRSRIEVDWYLNLSYYMGDQWIFWNRGRIDRPKLEDWRVMFTDNRILPAVVSRVARKTKNRPSYICTPATADQADMNNAEIGEKVLDNDWKALNLDYKHLLAEFWAEIAGAGFWKIYWDSSAGEKADFLYANGKAIPDPQKGGPMRADSQAALAARAALEAAGMPVTVRTVALGDMATEVITPFELYPDPLAKHLDDCEWIVEEKIRSKEYCLKKWPQLQTVEEDTEVPIGIAESRMFSPGANSQNTGTQAKGVRVYEYFCKPNKRFPKGKWAIWLNKKVIEETTIEGSPYAEFPYVMFSSNIVPGRFWPTAITTQLRGPQTDLNKLQSQIRENAIRIGNPPIGISREANVEWTGKIGERFLYSDTVQNPLPTPIQMPEIPTYVREEVARIENSITEISGIHDVSNASVPSGVTAASAINLLQEADDTRLGPEIQLMEKTIAQAGTYHLKLRAKFTTDERLIRIAGEDGGWDMEGFKGEVLDSIINVDVQAGSGMPRNKAAKQAAMQELLNMALQYGVPLNARSMRKFFKDYEMGGLDRLFQDLENDESQINRENHKLYAGEMFGINDFDNDDLHIEGHQEEMKSAKFEQADPKAQGVFIAHWKEHMKRRMAGVEAQVRAQQESAELEGHQNMAEQQQSAEHEQAIKETPPGENPEEGESSNG